MDFLFEKTALKNSLTSKLLTAVKKQKVIPHQYYTKIKQEGRNWERKVGIAPFSQISCSYFLHAFHLCIIHALVSFFMPLSYGSSLLNASLEEDRRQAPRGILISLNRMLVYQSYLMVVSRFIPYSHLISQVFNFVFFRER